MPCKFFQISEIAVRRLGQGVEPITAASQNAYLVKLFLVPRNGLEAKFSIRTRHWIGRSIHNGVHKSL